jgi:hypothetical protein
MATEYRVKWKREGLRPKRIRYTSMKAAERRLALLTSDEPWLYYGGVNDPSDYQCCSGHECGCGGITVREHCEQRRAEMPPIEYAVIECRPVGAWVSVEQHNASHEGPGAASSRTVPLDAVVGGAVLPAPTFENGKDEK